MIALAAALAALVGVELVARSRLPRLGWWLVVAAPVEAGVLLAANWREHVSRDYGSVLVSATALLLSGIVVGGLALAVDERSKIGRAGFAVVAGSALALDVLSLVVTWMHVLPGEALRAILSLIFLTIILALLTPVVQQLSAPSARG